MKELKYEPTMDILGINVAITNMNKSLKFVFDLLDALKGSYICVSNVHTAVMSHDDTSYRKIQNEACMILPDGKPLSVVQKRQGHLEAEKVSGPDFMPLVLQQSLQNGQRHFFYGSTDKTLKLLQKNLLEKYPTLQIAGMYAPPFRELTEKEDQDIIQMINDSKADFLWVGLGAPKQEIWMAKHKGKMNSLMIGVGAAFDFHAGTVRRAPKWMQYIGLEWFYRLLQDPKRLWKRYVVTNTKFIWYLMRG